MSVLRLILHELDQQKAILSTLQEGCLAVKKLNKTPMGSVHKLLQLTWTVERSHAMSSLGGKHSFPVCNLTERPKHEQSHLCGV